MDLRAEEESVWERREVLDNNSSSSKSCTQCAGGYF